jgi:hypothetical protein
MRTCREAIKTACGISRELPRLQAPGHTCSSRWMIPRATSSLFFRSFSRRVHRCLFVQRKSSRFLQALWNRCFPDMIFLSPCFVVAPERPLQEQQSTETAQALLLLSALQGGSVQGRLLWRIERDHSRE